jgi:putative SOS response-associated peptidase YedK
MRMRARAQVIELTRQQEMTKQQEGKAKEAEYRAQAAALAKVCVCGLWATWSTQTQQQPSTCGSTPVTALSASRAPSACAQ